MTLKNTSSPHASQLDWVACGDDENNSIYLLGLVLVKPLNFLHPAGRGSCASPCSKSIIFAITGLGSLNRFFSAVFLALPYSKSLAFNFLITLSSDMVGSFFYSAMAARPFKSSNNSWYSSTGKMTDIFCPDLSVINCSCM